MASCGSTWKFPVLRRHPKLICRPIPLCVLTKSHFNPSRNSTSTVYRNLLHLNLYWKVDCVRPPALEVPKTAPGERLQNVAKLLPRLVHTSTWKSETQSSLLVTTNMPGPLQHTSESNLLWMSMSRGTEQYPQWRRPANRGHRNNSFNNFEVEWTRSQWSMGHDSTKASPAANSTPVTWGTELSRHQWNKLSLAHELYLVTGLHDVIRTCCIQRDEISTLRRDLCGAWIALYSCKLSKNKILHMQPWLWAKSQ